MRRKQGLATFNHRAAVRLESIRGVVERNAKQYADERVGQAIQAQLQPGIIDDPTAFHKARAEHGVPALVERDPIAHYVAAIVRFIGHHDDHRITVHLLQSANDGAAETVGGFILYQARVWNVLADCRYNS